MKFSLIVVSKEHEDGSVEGYWVQDCVGSFHKAIGRAVSTSMANSGQMIAVVPAINSTVPILNYYSFENNKIYEKTGNVSGAK